VGSEALNDRVHKQLARDPVDVLWTKVAAQKGEITDLELGSGVNAETSDLIQHLNGTAVGPS